MQGVISAVGTALFVFAGCAAVAVLCDCVTAGRRYRRKLRAALEREERSGTIYWRTIERGE